MPEQFTPQFSPPSIIAYEITQQHINRAYAAEAGRVKCQNFIGHLIYYTEPDGDHSISRECCCPNSLALHDKLCELFPEQKFSDVITSGYDAISFVCGGYVHTYGTDYGVEEMIMLYDKSLFYSRAEFVPKPVLCTIRFNGSHRLLLMNN